jgi:hypothetical protein
MPPLIDRVLFARFLARWSLAAAVLLALLLVSGWCLLRIRMPDLPFLAGSIWLVWSAAPLLPPLMVAATLAGLLLYLHAGHREGWFLGPTLRGCRPLRLHRMALGWCFLLSLVSALLIHECAPALARRAQRELGLWALRHGPSGELERPNLQLTAGGQRQPDGRWGPLGLIAGLGGSTMWCIYAPWIAIEAPVDQQVELHLTGVQVREVSLGGPPAPRLDLQAAQVEAAIDLRRLLPDPSELNDLRIWRTRELKEIAPLLLRQLTLGHRPTLPQRQAKAAIPSLITLRWSLVALPALLALAVLGALARRWSTALAWGLGGLTLAILVPAHLVLEWRLMHGSPVSDWLAWSPTVAATVAAVFGLRQAWR